MRRDVATTTSNRGMSIWSNVSAPDVVIDYKKQDFEKVRGRLRTSS